MGPKKILAVIEIYRGVFTGRSIEPVDYPHDQLLRSARLGLPHCAGMLDKIVGFVNTGRIEKAFRWLGFVQGVLWATGICTLKELMDHNRPDRSE